MNYDSSSGKRSAHETFGEDDESLRDQSLLKELFRSHFPNLVKGLRRSFGDGPPDPADVAQEAILKLGERRNLHEISDLEGYAWICARNIIIADKRANLVRIKNEEEVKERNYPSQCDEFDPERILNGREELEIVMATIAKLPERRRRLLLMCRAEGLTPAEAARRTGLSRTAVVRHIAKGMAAIDEALERGEENGEADL